MSDMKLSVLIGAIDKFSAPAKKIAGLSENMTQKPQQAQQRTAALGRQLSQTAEPTKQLRRQFDLARQKSDALKRKHSQQKTELRGAGVDTRKLGL